MKSDSINELATALAKAQGEIKGAIKDSTNPHYKSKYADIASVWDACRGPLSKHGLSITQTLDQDELGQTLVTTLLHSSGQWIESAMALHLSKPDMQGLGSSITYARRYSLAAMVGVAQEDDDGERSVGAPKIVPEQPPVTDGYQLKDAPYRIPFGKFAKKGLHEIDVSELRGYVEYLEREHKKKNKPLDEWMKDFISRATNYICVVEGGFKDFNDA